MSMNPSTNQFISERIRFLFEQDQLARATPSGSIDLSGDSLRLSEAIKIYEEFNPFSDFSADDLYMLGMIFQHGPNVEDSKRAMELSELSGEKGNKKGKWLAAAAEDRYLTRIGKKQKWGTQFIKQAGGEWAQSPMQTDEESGITDEMRVERDVPVRDHQLAVFLSKQSN